MPANSDISSKYKSYIGRVFLIRKHTYIPASLEKKAGKRQYFEREKTFGDACLVFDETNARVKVTKLGGGFLWISKFYLHKELENDNFIKHDNISEIIDKLIQLGQSEVIPEEQSETLYEAVKILRKYADTLKPNNLKH